MAVPASAGPGGPDAPPPVRGTCRWPAARAGIPSSTGRLSSIPVAARFPDCAVRAAPRPRLCPCAGCAGTATAAAEADSGVLPGARPVRRCGGHAEPAGAAPPHPPTAAACASTASPRVRQPSPSPPCRPASRRCPHPRTRRAVGTGSRRIPPAQPSRPFEQEASEGRASARWKRGRRSPSHRARQPHRSPQPCSISHPTTTP